MNILNSIKSIYAPPSAEKLALQELEESRRELLRAQAGKEYMEAMASYHATKISRLTKFLKQALKDAEQ
jgi:hypothetical protein